LRLAGDAARSTGVFMAHEQGFDLAYEFVGSEWLDEQGF
jgi:hypothetical protein